MATGTAKSTLPPPVVDPTNAARQASGGHPTSGYGESVERQLRQTQRQVKFVDLCTALMALVAGVVGYLLVISLIDHWIIGLGFFGRLLTLGTLLVGCAWHFSKVVLPLITHRINPLYAARSIEQGTPSLKNSLINFLMFRADPSSVHRVVYQAMEQKAATDLASVPVDTAVDRSKMIHVGYLLIAVLVTGAAYTILSPKDPFQTVARIALPWQTIARPSRIVIEDIQPGTIEVIQGQFVDITARIRGAREGKDIVSLIYSTDDGQTVERFVTMQLDENGLVYRATLPADPVGLQHDLEYRLESGDASSETFVITLSPAPTILVDSITYEYPSYTNRRRETVRRDGNIRAIEGSRVTIVANANKPIRSAKITFNPFEPSDATRPPVELAMEFQGTTARKTFTLALTDDHQTPLYDSYQLSFATESGAVSEHPILHQIDVVPDLAPEVEILDPTQNRITIPVSGRRKIEVRAVDPDFGLSRLMLRAVAGGTNVLEETLFEDAVGRRGQTIVTYEFVPSRLGLVAYDKVAYWAVVEDNRMSIGNSAANSARTRNYQIEIVPDPPKKNRRPDEASASEEGPREPSDGQPQPGRNPDDPSDTGGTDNPPQDDETTEPSTSPNEPGEQEEDDDNDNDENSESEDGAGNESGNSGSSDGEAEEGGGGGAQEGQSKPGDSSSSGGSGGNTPQTGGQPDAASSGQGGDDPPPDQLHDGEVFEKVLRKIEEEQANGKGRPDPNGNGAGENDGSSPPGNNTDNPGDGTPSEKPPGQADDQSKPQGDAEGDSEGSDTNSQPFSEDGQPKPGQKDPKPGDGDGAQQPDRKRGAGEQKVGNPGEGGDTNDGSGEQQGKQKPDVPGEPDEREKEPGSGDNGESGAGQNSEDTEGSGSVESSQDQAVNNRDKPKNRNPDSTEPQEKSDPGSTNSKKQSDSEGGESGVQSGGGKKGPGQSANQAGNDSAGQNNSADDGAGASSEAGDGESSDAAGTKQEAPGKTGTAGNKKGDGDSSRKDPNGNRDNKGTSGSSPEAEPGQENRQPKDRQDGGGGGNRPGESGLPVGGGVPSDVRHNSGLDPDMEVTEGDDTNLEYSRKATDLVIDYLKDLESREDPKLLDELGWTPEEMQQFVDRWQRLKRSAADAPGRRELDESLRSLGLRSPENKLRQRRVRDDDRRGLTESGVVSEPPEAFRDLFNAFKKGTARVREN
jgi:hypothetical protein